MKRYVDVHTGATWRRPVAVVASRGTGTHEVLQIVLPRLSSHAQALSAARVAYEASHGAWPDGEAVLAVEAWPDDGRESYTVLVYARDGEDPS